MADLVNARGHLVHRGECGWLDAVVETSREAYGAEHAQLIFRKSQRGVADGTDEVGVKVLAAADKIQDFPGNRIHQQAIDGEVAASNIFARIFAVTHLVGVPSIAVADVGAEGCYLNHVGFRGSWGGGFTSVLGGRVIFFAGLVLARNRHQHDAELGAHGIRFRENPHDLLRRGVSGDVIVGRLATEQQIAHAAAAEVSLVTAVSQRRDNRGSELFAAQHSCEPTSNNIEGMADTYILGIESSCDETGAAVVRSGEQILSNVVFSQIATHMPYGGVVPELASREHLRAIVPVVRKALADAGQTYQSVDALAVTQGPGLAGALLVGLSYAKALAFALEKPLIAVNHLEGHIHAVLLEERQKGNHEVQFPVLALVVSGGHTHLYLATQRGNSWTYENIGHTRDDAAGEAFDKVAKLLGLGYPGGPVIDRLSTHGDARAVKFPAAQIKHRDRRDRLHGHQIASGSDRPRFDFSYSGIKTAILRYVETHQMRDSVEQRRRALTEIPKPTLDDIRAHCDKPTLDLVASFQRALIEDLVGKTLAAAEAYHAATPFFTSRVAAAPELQQTYERERANKGRPRYFTSWPFSPNNPALI